MLNTGDLWINSYNPKNKPSNKDTEGKWIIRGEKTLLNKLFDKINKLVDKGKINSAKYNPKENLKTDLLPYWKPVICVYADDDSKDEVKKILENLGAEVSEWKYNSQTEMDWSVGGKLYREYEEQRARYFLEMLVEEEY